MVHKTLLTQKTDASKDTIIAIINSGYAFAVIYGWGVAQADEKVSGIILQFAESFGLLNSLHHIAGKIKLKDVKGNKTAWKLVKALREC